MTGKSMGQWFDSHNPLPVGYIQAPERDAVRPLICLTCGASVSQYTGAEIHTRWHAEQAKAAESAPARLL